MDILAVSRARTGRTLGCRCGDTLVVEVTQPMLMWRGAGAGAAVGEGPRRGGVSAVKAKGPIPPLVSAVGILFSTSKQRKQIRRPAPAVARRQARTTSTGRRTSTVTLAASQLVRTSPYQHGLELGCHRTATDDEFTNARWWGHR